nr:hypothetical protein BaRGS_031347 [Batillaria attramentaria]
MQSALRQANTLEREYGTQSAFGMSSRWLLIPTGGDNLLDHLHVSNVTMDNVALLQEADVGLVPTDMIFDRTPMMDFSSPVVFSSFVMMYRKPEAARDFQVVLGPLSSTVLLTIGASLLLVSLLLFAYEVTLRSTPGRVLLGSWWMFSLVMAAAYSGTLTAFISVPKDTQLFSSLQDLVAKQHDYKWGCVNNTALALVLKTLHDNGILSRWTANWFPRAACPTPTGSKVISLLDVQGVLLVVPVGVGLALLVLVVEKAYARRRRE